MARQKTKICISCNQLFRGRQDARTCSERCRKRLQRAKLLVEQEASSLQTTAENIISRVEHSITPFATEEGFVGSSAGVATAATPAFSPVAPAKIPSTPAPASKPYAPPTPVSQPVVPAPTPVAPTSFPITPVSTPTNTDLPAYQPVVHTPQASAPVSSTSTTPFEPALQTEPLETPSSQVVPSSMKASVQPSSNSLPVSTDSQIASSPAHLPETATPQTQFRSDSLELNPSSVFPVSSPTPSPVTPSYPVSQPQVITPANLFDTPAIVSQLTSNPTQPASSILPTQTTVSKTSKSMPRLPGFSFPSWARVAIASTAIVSIVSIGTYLLANQNAQTKISSQTTTTTTTSQDSLPSGSDVTSLHFNKAVTIGQGANFTATGTTTFKNLTNSANALNVQNAAGDNLIAVDTATGKVTINGLQGAGTDLTALNASNLTTGTVASVRLAGNVTLLGNSFNGVNQLIQLDSNGALPALNGTNLTNLNGSNITGTLSDSKLSANVALLNGTGPQNFTGNNSFTGNTLFKNAVNSTTSLQIQNAAGTSNLLVADTTNSRLAINQTTATYALDVNGDINVTTGHTFKLAGTDICTASGCTAVSGSGNYIQNNTVAVQSANFNIQSTATNQVAAIIQGAASQTADVLEVKDSTNNNLFAVSSVGNVNIQGNLIPNANNTQTIGTPSYYWHNVYTDTLTANTIAAAGSTIAGTTAADFTINSDNPVGDTEDMNLIYYRGGSVANAVLGWDHTNTTFTLNQPLKIQNIANSATAFQVQNAAGNTFIQVDTSGGNLYLGDIPTVGTSNIYVGAQNKAVDQNIKVGSNIHGTSDTYLTLGSNANASSTTIQGGTGGLSLAPSGSSNTGVLIKATNNSTNALLVQNSSGSQLLGIDTSGALVGLVKDTGVITVAGASNYNARLNISTRVASVAGIVVRSTASQSADFIDLQDINNGNANVFSVGASGNTLVKTTVNSATAFQVQNANSQNLFQVDTSNNVITLNGSNSGALAAWNSNTSLPLARGGTTSATANGYVYVIGGYDGVGQYKSTVHYAKLNSNGTTSSWSTTTAMPDIRFGATATVANGYLYVLGGVNNSNDPQAVAYYAKLNSDGTVGAWSTATNAPPGRFYATSVVANGYLYYLGGDTNHNGSAVVSSTTVSYTKLNGNGSLGVWATTTALPQAIGGQTSVVANGYIYVLGGHNGSTTLSTVYYATLSSSGTISSWTTNSGNPLPAAMTNHSSVVANGYVYAYANGTAVYYAVLNSNGSTGSWTTNANSLPQSVSYAGTAIANGYIYVFGGIGGTYLTTVYYASTSRVQLGGALDLVGLAGQDQADPGSFGLGSTGGSLTAGDGTFVGNIQIQGQANLAQSLIMGGNLSSFGYATFKNSTDTTSAFQIQNAAGTSNLFVADTTNNRVGIGTATPGAPLHVLNGAAGATFTPVTDETIVLQRNTATNSNAVLTLVSGSVGSSIIRLTNAGATEAGKIGYDSSVNALYFFTNGAEKLRIASTGALTVAGGQTKDIATASAGTSSAITIQPGDSTTNSGTGSNLTLQGSNNTGTTSTGGNVVIQGGTGTSINGQVQIATSGLANTVQIGNTTGAVAQTINIGNNATASSATTITIGSTIGTSPMTLQAGSTGIIAKTTSTTAFVLQKADGTGTILTADTSAGTITVGGLLTVSSSGIAFSDGTTQTSAAAKSKVVNVSGDEQMLFYWDSTLNEWVTPRFTLIQIAPDPAQNFGVAFQSVNAEHTVQAGVVAVSAKYAAGMKLDLRWEGYAWVDQQHTTLGRLYGYQSNNNQNPLANFPTSLGSGKLYNDISIYPGNQGAGGTEANFDTGWLGGITATSTVQNTLLVKAAAIDNAGTENIRVGGNIYARWVMP